MWSVPPSLTPALHWSTEHITELGVAGVCVLSGLYAWKSWVNSRRRDRSSRTVASVMMALAVHVSATAFVASYRDLVVDVGVRVAGGADVADVLRALLVGAAVTAVGIVTIIVAANRVYDALSAARS